MPDGNIIRLGTDFEILDGLQEDTREAVAPDRWFHHWDNCLALGRYLLELGYTAEELQSYYEHHDRFSDEWNEFLRTG